MAFFERGSQAKSQNRIMVVGKRHRRFRREPQIDIDRPPLVLGAEGHHAGLDDARFTVGRVPRGVQREAAAPRTAAHVRDAGECHGALVRPVVGLLVLPEIESADALRPDPHAALMFVIGALARHLLHWKRACHRPPRRRQQRVEVQLLRLVAGMKRREELAVHVDRHVIRLHVDADLVVRGAEAGRENEKPCGQ
jgi:hypothetical protein